MENMFTNCSPRVDFQLLLTIPNDLKRFELLHFYEERFQWLWMMQYHVFIRHDKEMEFYKIFEAIAALLISMHITIHAIIYCTRCSLVCKGNFWKYWNAQSFERGRFRHVYMSIFIKVGRYRSAGKFASGKFDILPWIDLFKFTY